MATIPRTSKDFFKSAFIVGITGHMNLDPAHRNRVKSEVKRFFAWLRASPRDDDKNEGNISLGPSLGLQNTPIVLLVSEGLLDSCSYDRPQARRLVDYRFGGPLVGRDGVN